MNLRELIPRYRILKNGYIFQAYKLLNSVGRTEDFDEIVCDLRSHVTQVFPT